MLAGQRQCIASLESHFGAQQILAEFLRMHSNRREMHRNRFAQSFALLVALPVLRFEHQLAAWSQLAEHASERQLKTGIAKVQVDPLGRGQAEYCVKLRAFDVEQLCVGEHIVSVAKFDIEQRRMLKRVRCGGAAGAKVSSFGGQLVVGVSDEGSVDIDAGHGTRTEIAGNGQRDEATVAANVQNVNVVEQRVGVLAKYVQSDVVRVFGISVAVVSVVVAVDKLFGRV